MTGDGCWDTITGRLCVKGANRCFAAEHGMKRHQKERSPEIRVSPVSFLLLLACWLGISILAFYIGMMRGRMEQMRELRDLYRAPERTDGGEEPPPFSFTEALESPLGVPSGSGAAAGKGGPVGGDGRAGTGRSGLLEETSRRAGAMSRGEALQVASFRGAEGAERLVKILREKGYPCFRDLSGSEGSGTRYWRVFVGPFHAEGEARRTKERLEKEEGLEGIMIRSMDPMGRP